MLLWKIFGYAIVLFCFCLRSNISVFHRPLFQLASLKYMFTRFSNKKQLTQFSYQKRNWKLKSLWDLGDLSQVLTKYLNVTRLLDDRLSLQ